MCRSVSGMKFTCYRCIHCCFFAGSPDYPILTESDYRRLKKIATQRGINLKFRRMREGLYQWVIEGFCPFYDVKKRGCSIYNYRPSSCRMFPLLLNPSTGEVSVSLLCDWVMENFSKLREASNPAEVFPEEFKAVISVFKYIKENQTQ